jgi:hypothetical protein
MHQFQYAHVEISDAQEGIIVVIGVAAGIPGYDKYTEAYYDAAKLYNSMGEEIIIQTGQIDGGQDNDAP